MGLSVLGDLNRAVSVRTCRGLTDVPDLCLWNVSGAWCGLDPCHEHDPCHGHRAHVRHAHQVAIAQRHQVGHRYQHRDL